MKKDFKILILIIIFILILSFVTYWQFKSFRESLQKIKLPKFEMPSPESFFSQQIPGEKEFVSPDGKLKLKYPDDWMKMEEESLERINQEIIKEEARILFFAQKIKLEKVAFASLIIQEKNLEKGQVLEEIIDKMKKEVEEKGNKIDIVKLEIDDKVAYFEAKYIRKEGPIFYSREKIILDENKAYYIAALALEKDWPEFDKEVSEIFNSVEVL